MTSACAPAASPPAGSRHDAIDHLSVAPQSTGSPNEPVLLVGPQRPPEPRGSFERVPVAEERPDASLRPPKDRCPEGLTELIAVHLPLGDAMELAAGVSPVRALGDDPGVVDVLFDPRAKVVRVVAKKYGLVYVLVSRDAKCTLYAVNSGY